MLNNALSRRRFLQLGAGAVGVAALAACAAPVAPTAGDSAGAGDAGGAAAEAVTLQWWSEILQDRADVQIPLYEEENPGVDVEFVSFKWGEMTPKLMTASAGGTAPNLTTQDRFRMAGWAGRGGAHPLDDYVELYSIDPEAYWPATWAEGQWQGHTYSIPFNTDGRFIFWNKDLFEAAGLDPEVAPPTEDWAAMIDWTTQLTTTMDDGSVNVMGFVPSQALGYGNGGDYVYAWANSGEFMQDDFTAWMDNPKLVEALQWSYDCVEAVGGIQQAAEFSAGWPTIAGFSPFGAGKLAMMVSGDWNLANFDKYYPDINFGMAPWNMRNDTENVTGFAGGFCMAVPAGGESTEETYKLLNAMSDYDAQLSAALDQQNIPCLVEAALSDDLINSSPYPEYRRLANESMAYANFRPITPVGQEIQDLWTSPGTGRDWVMYGEKTAEQACADMQTQVQKSLDEYWASVA